MQRARTVVISAGSPIGEACSVRLASEGARLFLVDPSLEDLERVASRCGDHTADVHTHLSHLASEADAEAASAQCAHLWAAVDALVSCAAAMDDTTSGPQPLTRWREIVETNLLGPMLCVQAFLPLLRSAKKSAVVLLSSIDGLRGNPRFPAYSATKAGLIPLTHILAYLHGSEGVRVNCVAMAGIWPQSSPAPEPTPASKTIIASLRSHTPLGRMPDASEIAAAMVFLASPDSSYVTGTVLTVDGGRTAITPGTVGYSDAT